MKISACVITKNEEKNIETCISSYKEIVDEIIIVDTGSDDKTVEIAQKLGARVYYFEWINDFAAAKNYALSKATGEWIIFLDADEYFDVSKVSNLPNIILKYGKIHNAIACKMINIEKNTGDVIDEFINIRIFKKGVTYNNKIHESLYVKNGKLNIIYRDKNELLMYHTGYSKSIVEEKIKRNMELLEKEFKEGNDSAKNCYYLSDCYYGMMDFENAMKYAKLAQNKGFDIKGFEIKPYQIMIDSMIKLNYDEVEIDKVIDKALRKFSNHPVLYLFRAWNKYRVKKYDESLKNCKKTIEVQKMYTDLEVNFVSANIHEIYYNIGKIYEIKNDINDAIENYMLSLKTKPFYNEAFDSIMNILFNDSDENIISRLNSIYNIEDRKNIEFLVDRLKKFKLRTVLFYYYKILCEKFKSEDGTIMYVLLGNGKYDKALELFYRCYLETKSEEYAILSIVSALESKNKEYLDLIQESLNYSLKKIINVYLNTSISEELDESDIDSFCKILRELVIIGNQDVIQDFIELRLKFVVNIDYIIAEIFENSLMYSNAITEYLNISKYKFEDIKSETEILLKLAICHYRVDNFSGSYEALKKALELGYRDNDIHEYLSWIRERSGDVYLENSINGLLENYLS
jgi:glycosyltransferase involved in cell wall biosynthesis